MWFVTGADPTRFGGDQSATYADADQPADNTDANDAQFDQES